MRQPERDARQGRSTDIPAPDGCGVDVRELTDADLPTVEARLPLNRLPGGASVENVGALRLHRRLGYVDAGLAPQRVQGTVHVRSGPLEVDDTLVYLVKNLCRFQPGSFVVVSTATEGGKP